MSPKRAADPLLATGVYPQQFFPRLIVDVTAHSGIEKSLPGQKARFVDRVECAGKLTDVVSDAVDAVVRNLRTYSVIDGTARHEVPEIPVVVIREAIANAVVHREYTTMFLGQPVSVDIYSDRIEIINPGGLWGGVTRENLGDGVSRCRNQTLLPLMQHVATEKSEGFTVEGQGSGIRLMISEMEAHALRLPKFTVSPDQVKVTLPRQGTEVPEQRERLNTLLANGAPLPSDDDAAIIRGLSGKPPQSIHEISEWSGFSLGALRTRLRHLVDGGWVRATAPPQSRNRKYTVQGDAS